MLLGTWYLLCETVFILPMPTTHTIGMLILLQEGLLFSTIRSSFSFESSCLHPTIQQTRSFTNLITSKLTTHRSSSRIAEYFEIK